MKNYQVYKTGQSTTQSNPGHCTIGLSPNNVFKNLEALNQAYHTWKIRTWCQTNLFTYPEADIYYLVVLVNVFNLQEFQLTHL